MTSYARVNGIDLSYYDSAPGDGGRPVVVLLHGLGGNWRLWRYQQPFLEELGYRVLALDQRGHGGSTKPRAGWTVEDMASDAAALLRELSIESAVVVGHSMGGMVAYQMGHAFPEMVSALVIVNSFSKIPAVRPKAIVKLLFRTSVIYSAGLQAWARILAWELLPGLSPQRWRLRSELVELSKDNDDRRAYMNSLKATVKADLVDRLPGISCPALLLAAEWDYTPTEMKLEDAALLNRNRASSDPQARVVEISDSRHLSLWDQPVRLNDEIAAFLKDSGL